MCSRDAQVAHMCIDLVAEHGTHISAQFNNYLCPEHGAATTWLAVFSYAPHCLLCPHRIESVHAARKEASGKLSRWTFLQSLFA